MLLGNDNMQPRPALTWIVLKESSSAFSLQNCRMILMTLRRRGSHSVKVVLAATSMCCRHDQNFDISVQQTHSVASISRLISENHCHVAVRAPHIAMHAYCCSENWRNTSDGNMVCEQCLRRLSRGTLSVFRHYATGTKIRLDTK